MTETTPEHSWKSRIVLSILSPLAGAFIVLFTLGLTGHIWAVKSFVTFITEEYYLIAPAMMVFSFLFLTAYDYYHTDDNPTANPS